MQLIFCLIIRLFLSLGVIVVLRNERNIFEATLR